VGIVGGSIAGCATAVELIGAGHEVKLFERSAGQLVSRGAGIGTMSVVLDGMIARDLLDADFPRLKVPRVRYVCKADDRAGERWLGDVVGPGLEAVNWAQMFEQLRRRVPDDVYRAGVEVEGLEATSSRATVHTSDGGSESFDLLVCADGYRTIGRPFVAPGCELAYRGMVLWRGLVQETDEDSACLAGGMTRIVYPGGHGIAYLIPGPDGDTRVGGRLAMWGFYLQISAPDLDSVLVDDEGRQHSGAVPFGKVLPQVSDRFRERLDEEIPPYFLNLVDRAPISAIQAIHSVHVPVYARQRVCLVGDAGSLLPPFTGSGVLKAMGNATSLALSLSSAASLDEGLMVWSRSQSEANAGILPVAEGIERLLVFEAPDLRPMSATDANAWMTAVHPGLGLILPEGDVASPVDGDLH
jgi:2-polyprenyl-6-methoxyphenol hydroxylase-like FAD-dependent oxidoreductase